MILLFYFDFGYKFGFTFSHLVMLSQFSFEVPHTFPLKSAPACCVRTYSLAASW